MCKRYLENALPINVRLYLHIFLTLSALEVDKFDHLLLLLYYYTYILTHTYL